MKLTLSNLSSILDVILTRMSDNYLIPCNKFFTFIKYQTNAHSMLPCIRKKKTPSDMWHC